MAKGNSFEPKTHHGVMVSSTFADLEEHRAALIHALEEQGLFPVAMEHYATRPDDEVISASLRMVRESAAYVCLIGRRCGQCPSCADRNPKNYSITRLEFEEAVRLGRPAIVFDMERKHLLTVDDVDTDPELIDKLAEFRERAKKGRIYFTFGSLDDFKVKATRASAELRRFLEEQEAARDDDPTDSAGATPAAAPAFHAEPEYLGSHDFVGRRSELEVIDDWADPADTHPLLLFEAMGGTGKSMLTWHWVKTRSEKVATEWAGRYWYSFYERGAMMEDFARHAVAYIRGVASETLNKLRMPDLAEELLGHLKAKAYLFILDGLERVLVTYNRFDAAQLADEDADQAKDQISNRDPCSAIRPEDDQFLRNLAAASRSKILISTRLTPSCLLNPSRQAIPGVKRLVLGGLRPADAEELLKSQGVRGNPTAIQAYLQKNCDCHPLVTGVLAGLINDYLPDRGNFDKWALDAGPTGGASLNLADHDLKQRKHHILEVAIKALKPKSRQLLSTLALISQAVDYETLQAFNPHLPPALEEATVPAMPQNNRAARRRLAETVKDLERRGLIQYDANSKRHDLHPVVRGVVSGSLKPGEKTRFGQNVVDYFNARPHNPYAEAATLADVEAGVQVVRTLIQMGKMSEAVTAYRSGLSGALQNNLEARAETLSLLRPFFPDSWGAPPGGVSEYDAGYLCNDAANTLMDVGDDRHALAAYSAALLLAARSQEQQLPVALNNVGGLFLERNRLGRADWSTLLALDVASALGKDQAVFTASLQRMRALMALGRYLEAQDLWERVDPMGRVWSRSAYRPGEAEMTYAELRFEQGTLRDEDLVIVEGLARNGKNRVTLRRSHSLRGDWLAERGQWGLAAESLSVAVRMAREVGQVDAKSETLLALAHLHLGTLPDPTGEAERLSSFKQPARRPLAELWLAAGDKKRAVEHAIAAYTWAWSEGEPFVRRYELKKSSELLTRLGEPIPSLSLYDPGKDPPFDWEADVEDAIKRLKEAKAKA